MILGFDIGNTNTVLGIYRDEDTSPVKIYRFRTIRDQTADELYALIREFTADYKSKNLASNIDGFVFSSVVPEVNRNYFNVSEDYYGIKPLNISSGSRLGIKINYDDPAKLGVDRIVNAEAAFREYKQDSIIIDMGTAITFCVLHANGLYDGGLIAPGIGITIDALAAKASLLHKINLEKPEKLVATNTREALTSGFFYGWLSMIEGIIDKIESQYGKKFLPVITGGYAHILSPAIRHNHVIDPLLTMKGIIHIYRLNR